MKKRLFCLLLCLATLLTSVLASCAKKDDESATEDIKADASENAMTLTMWIVSKDKITDAAAAAVSEQVNSVTKAKFKTELVINYLTEAEYATKLEETINAYEANRGNQPEVPAETESETETGGVVTDETETNEWGLNVIKYPDLVANQVDIIYIAGEDMYIDFIEKEWLSELDTELSSSSKKIKEYVSTTLLSAAKYNGTTYAIPNNLVIGEYTYMLLNKDLMKKYNQHAYAEKGMIDGFYNENLYSFLNLVSLFEKDIIPVDATYEECLDLLAHYWSIDPESYEMLNEFSVFGYHYDNIDELNRGSTILGYNSLFEDEEFVEDYLKINEFRFKDYFNLGKDNETRTGGAAVKFVNGDANILAKNEYVDENGVAYYPVVVGYPTASSNDIYGNMFGVCKYTRSVSRSMQIITYLNTNADFRNLIQYGVEGTHYKVVENENGEKSVERLNNDYLMDIYATGNAFLAYPDPLYEMSADIWESGKVQNRDSLVAPLLGFDIADFSANAEEEEEKVDLAKVGYNISYSTGYSKDILCQDAMIKQWIDECDAAGKGVYMLKTSMIDGQYLTATYYIYNNNLTKNVNFSVVDNRVTEIRVDEKGKESEVQTDLDFILTYTDAAGNSQKGYELSMVNLYTRKNNEFEFKCKVNDADTAINAIKDQGALYNFDFYNTQQYRMEVYANIGIPAIMKNDTLFTWVSSCNAKITGRKVENYLMSFKKDLGEQYEYTFVVYRNNLQFVTATQFLALGEKDALELSFTYTDNGEDKLDTSEPNYNLYYIRVVADKSVKVTTSYSYNGDKVTPAAETEGEPNFVICGNLDTELIKYLANVNETLTGALEAKFQEYYAAYKAVANDPASTPAQVEDALNLAIASYKAVVAEMSALMVTGEKTPVYGAGANFPLLASYISKFVTPDRFDYLGLELELGQFHRYIRMATSYEKQPIMGYDSEGNIAEVNYNGKEDFVYYDSPYAAYYKWMEKYGYMPSEKK